MSKFPYRFPKIFVYGGACSALRGLGSLLGLFIADVESGSEHF